ncbi:MAG TPA: transcriptional regulator [Candidatus Angelobacter sp.]
MRIVVVTCLLLCVSLQAQRWQPLGPDGGTVRSLAFDPQNPDRIFLGTSAGWLYLSNDGGANWARLSHLGSGSEMVLDHIVVEAGNNRNLYVAAWNAQSPNSDGEVFRSRDGGKTWDLLADIHGKSVRALALAPSSQKVLVAGTLDGVFRSNDGGDRWERISPPNHAEIRNVESIAIDPVNPDVIYAGTWHLPWKTEDGGKSWHSIKKGVIDDSDVFSIVIDSQNASSVYISACSGIYKSDTAGDLFRKIQGIPYSARRTRMLKLDPSDHNVVYAGTTEGLWKSADAGATFKRMTGANVIINDVLIDPRRPARVLLATDRGGVLLSDDGGATFVASNHGFTHRQVAALLLDRNDASRIYAGLLNDKEYGGVFFSPDAGRTWKQMSEGLDGRDVFVLRQAADNTLFAGTDRGLFRRKPGDPAWLPLAPLPEPKAEADPGKKKTPARPATASGLDGRVADLELTPNQWFAITANGLLASKDEGKTWVQQELSGIKYMHSLAVADRTVVVAGSNAISVSVNGGESWLAPRPLPPDVVINSIAFDPSGAGTIWAAARDGVYRSTDLGDTWKRVTSLRLANVVELQVDQENQRVLATGAASTNVYESLDNGRTWSPVNSGWLLRRVRTLRGRLLGATPFDGIVLQPESTADVQAPVSSAATR